jgi:polar amino acid transport system substrate-binding protein
MVLNDQADALVADYPICLVTLLRYQDKGLVTLDEPLTIEPIGIALPSDDPQFLNLVENYLNALELSGALQVLDQVWFEDGKWLLNMK